MFKKYRFRNEDNSLTDIALLEDTQTIDIGVKCPYCNSYSYDNWECLTGEHLSTCYCCGFNNSNIFQKHYDIDNEYVLVSNIKKAYRPKLQGYYAKIKETLSTTHNHYDIEIIKPLINEITEETISQFLEIKDDISLVKCNPSNNEIIIIEGLHKGLIINMKNYSWIYKK